ncbi:hypothetical protein GDO81_029996, partial [Engystomops pustulosus]
VRDLRTGTCINCRLLTRAGSLLCVQRTDSSSRYEGGHCFPARGLYQLLGITMRIRSMPRLVIYSVISQRRVEKSLMELEKSLKELEKQLELWEKP